MALKKALCIISGGMDSTLAAYLTKESGYEIIAVHFNYGQRTEDRELKAYRDIIKALDVQNSYEIDLPFFMQIGASALVDPTIAVPTEGIEPGVPVTYVPFRNGIFLSIAAAIAEKESCSAMVIGVVEEDSSGYPDCRESYIEMMQKAINLGTKDETHIEILRPLVTYTKAEIVSKALAHHVPLSLTWSCYQNSEEACGVCDSCRLRLKGFEKAEATDPIAYKKHDTTRYIDTFLPRNPHSKRIPQLIALNRLHPNIYRHDYAHLDRFLKESQQSCSIERFSSLKGEIFENNIYETIKDWASKDKKVKWFVLKGNHVLEKFSRNGLSFNNRKQIIYNVDGLEFAEFDTLFARENYIYFVEMTNSVKGNIARRYKKRILQKTKLLKRIFPEFTPICIVVLNASMKDQSPWLENTMFWYVNDLYIEYDDLVKMQNKSIKTKADFNKNLTAKKFPTFDYYKSTKQVTYQLYNKKNSPQDFSEFMQPYFGLHSKFYMGTINFETLKQCSFFEFDTLFFVDYFYVTLKMEPLTYPILTLYYFKDKQLISLKLDTFKGYEEEEVAKRKRTFVELRRLHGFLEERPINVDVMEHYYKYINSQFCLLV